MADDIKKEDKEVLEGKAYAILSYLWVLCLIPLLVKKDNKFALFHAKQGLVIFMGELIISIIGVIPVMGWTIMFFGTLLFGIVSLVGIVQVLLGNYWKLPIFGDTAEKIKF